MIGTFSGIAIVITAFSLGNILPRFARKAFFLAMFARLSISVLNVIMSGQMIGADADANRYYEEAVELSSNINDLTWDIQLLFSGWGFTNMHALIQWALGGGSFFLAHAFSLLGAALCLILISKIWLLLVPEEYKRLPYVLLIYSLLPSVLTNQSYILREVWQSLSVLGIAWLSLHIQKYGYSVVRIIGILMFTVAGCFLHSYMIVMIMMMFFGGLLLQNRISITRWYMIRPSRLFKFGFILILLLLILWPIIIESPILKTDINGKKTDMDTQQLLQKADEHSEGALSDSKNARAEYGKLFYPERLWTLLPTFAAYQTMPLPWRIGNISDVILFIENSFRILLLMFYLCYRKKLTQFHKDNMDVLVLMWFMMELVWSVGTINWGTAARHHVPAVALLVIVGLASRYLVKPEPLHVRRHQPTKQLGG